MTLKKKIIIAVISLAVLALAGFNVYYFGRLAFDKYNANLETKTANTVLSQVLQIVKKDGKIVLGDTTLIIQPATATKP